MEKLETVKFPIKKAFGKDLPKQLEGTYEYAAFSNKEEIPSGKLLNDDQYVAAVNAREVAKLRAKATSEALDAAGKEWTSDSPNPFKAPNQNDPLVIAENQVKLIMKLNNFNEETARKVYEAQQKIAASFVSAQS